MGETGQQGVERLLQELKAGIEEIDIAETIVQFTAAQNALEAALGAIGRTSNMTLLNFLR